MNKRILALLQNDARITATAIGKKVGLSRPAVQDRITTLEKAEVIQGYYTKIDISGSLVQALMFVTIAERPCDKALRWLEALEGVDAVYSLAGEIDAVVSVTVPSTTELSALGDKVLASQHISSLQTSVVLSRSRGR